MVSKFSKTAIFLPLNVDKSANKALADKYNIKGIPTTILLDREGKEVDRIIGYSGRTNWTKTLLGYMYGIDTLKDNLARASTNNSPKLGEKIAGKYLDRGKAHKALEWIAKTEKGLKKKDTKIADSLELLKGKALLQTEPAKGESLLSKLSKDGSESQLDEAFDTLSGYYQRQARKAKEPEKKKTFLDKMTSLYEAALPKHEDDSHFLNGYAWHFAEEGIDLDKALDAAKKAVDLSKGDPGILDTLAEVYYKKGMKQKALETIGKALLKDPNSKYFKKQKDKFLKMVAK